MHIASDSIRHRLHVRRDEHVLSFFHHSMYLTTCCILLSNATQAHVKFQQNAVTFTVRISNSRLHMSPRPSSEPYASPKPRPLLRAILSPHERAEPEPRTNGIGPGVSSFTVTSHDRPLTRGSWAPDNHESSKTPVPRASETKEAFLAGDATCLTSGLKAAASA